MTLAVRGSLLISAVLHPYVHYPRYNRTHRQTHTHTHTEGERAGQGRGGRGRGRGAPLPSPLPRAWGSAPRNNCKGKQSGR